MKKILILIMLIITILNVNAIEISTNTSFTSSESNSTIFIDQNITVKNITIEENHIILYEINYTKNSENYYCEKIYYSTPNSTLKTPDFNCTGTQASQIEQEDEGRNSYNSFESSKYSGEENIRIKVKVEKNSTQEIPIKNNKNTEIEKIKINSIDYITGEIIIKNLEIPKEKRTGKIYKILEVNSSINPEKIKEISIFIKINNSWKKDNDIYEIKTKKETNESLETQIVSQNKNYSTYEIKSKSFSILTIYGEEKPITEPTIQKPKEEKEKKISLIIEKIKETTKPYTEKIKEYWYITASILFLTILVIFFTKNKSQKPY